VPRPLEDEARKSALDSYLTHRLEEGFEIESRTANQAIIVHRSRLPKRLHARRRERRQLISVDQDGIVTASPAQPRRW
jgi:hypothetical protein